MGSVFDEKDGVPRCTSDAPPAHYMVKIQSFSLLLKNAIEKYESGEFEAGGYKWKLVFYPNGNKNKDVKDYISLYLAIVNASSLQLGWEVHAIFRFFLLDQNNDNYSIVHDGKQRRFNGQNLEWGFNQLIPLKAFNEASNGYLLEDSCVFGAEVFVTKERSRAKGECLSMIKDAPSSKHIWRIENFSNLDSECIESQVFNADDHKWKIQLYPKGRRNGLGSHLSLYLALAEPTTTLSPGCKIYAQFVLRILDQVQARHDVGRAISWFSASSQESGWARYISLGYFKQSSNGYLVKDVCLVEAEVTVHGTSRAL